jgi:hypothetical protein
VTGEGGTAGATVEGGAGGTPAGGAGGAPEPTPEELVDLICAKEPGGDACTGDCPGGFSFLTDLDDCEDDSTETAKAMLTCLEAAPASGFTCAPPLQADAETCEQESCEFYETCYGAPCE